MDPITEIVVEVAKTLGINPVAAAMLIPMFVILMNRVARVIPDTAEGPLKWVRIAAVILSAHVKDNSGVPAVLDKTGNVIRRTEVAQTPEPIQGAPLVDPEQPELFASRWGMNQKED